MLPTLPSRPSRHLVAVGARADTPCGGRLLDGAAAVGAGADAQADAAGGDGVERPLLVTVPVTLRVSPFSGAGA